MKKTLPSIFALTVAAAFLFTLHFSHFTSVHAAPKKNVSAVIISIQGKLFVKGTGSTKFAQASKGQFLYEGDVVKTDKTSLAAITFVTGVNVKMNSNTEFTITAKQIGQVDDELEMNKGQMYSIVLKRGSRFGVRSPVALAAVRGTEFDMFLQPGGLRLSVLEGVVELGNDYGQVNVNAGQYTNCGSGQSPDTPKDMSPDDKPSWMDGVKVDDKEEKNLTKKLQDSSTTQTTTPTGQPEEKTLRMEVDTPSGRKSLNLKFKKESK